MEREFLGYSIREFSYCILLDIAVFTVLLFQSKSDAIKIAGKNSD